MPNYKKALCSQINISILTGTFLGPSLVQLSDLSWSSSTHSEVRGFPLDHVLTLSTTSLCVYQPQKWKKSMANFKLEKWLAFYLLSNVLCPLPALVLLHSLIVHSFVLLTTFYNIPTIKSVTYMHVYIIRWALHLKEQMWFFFFLRLGDFSVIYTLTDFISFFFISQ